MRKISSDGRCAERTLEGFDDAGRAERIVIWLERQQGAVWAVGRAVNPQHRPSGEPRATTTSSRGTSWTTPSTARTERSPTTYTFSNGDGHVQDVPPFTRDELLKPLSSAGSSTRR